MLRLALNTIQTYLKTCWGGAVCFGFGTAVRLISRKFCVHLLKVIEEIRKCLCIVGISIININTKLQY